MLLSCEERPSNKSFDVARFRVHDGTQFEMKLRPGGPLSPAEAALQLFSNDVHNLLAGLLVLAAPAGLAKRSRCEPLIF